LLQTSNDEDASEPGCNEAQRKAVRWPAGKVKGREFMTTRARSKNGKSGKSASRKIRRTAAQRRARQNLGRFSTMWRELTEEQRTAWRLRAAECDRLVRHGQYYRLSGQQFFNKLNSVLALCGHKPLTDPPAQPQFGPNPVDALAIIRDVESLTIELSVSGTPTEDIMVFASPPQSAGRAYCGDYRFLGLLPAPVKLFSDIARLYIRKYGVPPGNTRIFIRAWQQVDGWICRGQMKLCNALVPARVWALPAQPPARTGRKRG
jgi:hypothetical protein